MRLFFHLVDSQTVIPDQEGVEVDDIAQAQDEALRAILEMRHANETAAVEWSGWRLDATDATGRVILSLDLNQVLRSQ
jgi:hypothetical protein